MPAVMLDLETLSTRSNAYILSIGAVEFDTKSGLLGRTFYELINGDGYAEHFHIDPATVRWWLNQTAEARALIGASERRSLPEALVAFDAFIRQCGDDACKVWGNGSDFDNVILGNAYRALKREAPWRHFNNRCFRTFKNIYNLVPPDAASAEQIAGWGAILSPGLPQGILTAHSALGDAISQARSLLSAYGHNLS